MTQENKQLLLKDLCARLPYNIKLGFENSDLILAPTDFNIYTMQLSTNQIYPKVDRAVIGHIYDVWDYRPYLRSMSSMTEEERNNLQSLHDIINNENYGDGYSPAIWEAISEWVDYCNSRHLDYHGLISMGLALEAPEGMYKTE